MANLLDYLFWRGDLPISARFPWNEQDNLVMARLSYLPLELIELGDGRPIRDVCEEIKSLPKEAYHFREDPKLCEALIDCERLGDLFVSDFVQYTGEQEEQFAAVTIHLPNKEMYLSFRGTDQTLVGWKEDFNMAFSTHIPSQKEALRYVQLIARKFPHEMMRLGGHSKGGNVAMYAALYMPERFKARVLEVLSFDGPGFLSEIMEENKDNAVIDRFRIYIPQESIVGLLLEMSVTPTIVLSENKNIHQHNIYNWQMDRHGFMRSEGITKGSLIMDETLKDWLEKTSPEQRQVFVDELFEVISATNAGTVREFGAGILKNLPLLLRGYRQISEEDRKTIMDMLMLFGKSYFGAFRSIRKQNTEKVQEAEEQDGMVTE
ncbi:MAG: DUF2974 domain-containing protein [Firmicutes bacterium]|nr:DUF2974 domain-containing protein [Bacillota bacterium]